MYYVKKKNSCIKEQEKLLTKYYKCRCHQDMTRLVKAVLQTHF